jgi:catalase
MIGVRREIQERWIEHCAAADPQYGAGVADVIESLR